MKEKILIFGDGQIGNFYKNFFDTKDIESKISKDTDITVIDQVKNAIEEYNPTVVINTAAKTNLEWCVMNKLETFNANVLGADNVAQVCDEKEVYYIYISSGCILSSKDENDKKAENDIPAPISYYAWTKVWSEQMIQYKKSANFKYLILRPRQPVSAQPSYKNTLMKMLTFSKFIDTPNSGTVIEDWMEWTLEFINKRATGVYHIANEGYTTPIRIGKMLKKYILPELPIELITKEELDKLMPEKRVDTVLSIEKAKKFGLKIRPFEERLEEIIKELAINIKNTDRKELKDQFDKTMEQTRARTVPNDVWQKLLD